MSVKRLLKIIEQQGWNVSIENLGKNAKCVELQRHQTGQQIEIPHSIKAFPRQRN